MLNSGSDTALIADLDGDSDLDVLLSNGRVLLNDGTGHFVESEKVIDDSNWNEAVLADFDSDGDVDALPIHFAKRSAVWLNDGTGIFRQGVDLTDTVQQGGFVTAAVADVDGDLDNDILFVSRRGEGRVWLNVVSAFRAGDANRDFQFDQRDIVQVLQAAKYLGGEPATFEEGDWNGDFVFDQLDIVAALQTGNYLQGPYAIRSADAMYAEIGA